MIQRLPILSLSMLPLARRSLPVTLGLQLGILMPIVSALLFPTYVHLMPLPWMERARLLELQFVAYELAVVAWAYSRGMEREVMLQALPRDVRWATLVLVGAIFASSALLSAHPADSLLQSLIKLVHLYFAAAVYFLAQERGRNDLDRVDDMIAWLVVGLVVMAIYTVWRFQYPPALSQVPGGKIEWDFALPGFISVRYLGIWCGGIAGACLIRILNREQNRQVDFWHLAYVFCAGFAMWSGTRAAILGIAGAAALFTLFTRGWPQIRAIVLAGGLTVLSFCGALIFRFDHPAFTVLRSSHTESLDRFSSGRLELWGATIERWWDSPFLGWGSGSLFWEVYLGWTHTQPHNAVLQFLFSWGIVGAVPALWILGRATYSATLIARSHPHFWPLLGMVFAFLTMSMVDGALYYPRSVIMVIVGLAIILAAAGKIAEVK